MAYAFAWPTLCGSEHGHISIQQANVSRTERRKDMKLSTLKRYIEAMGGELDIVAKFATNVVHLNLKEI